MAVGFTPLAVKLARIQYVIIKCIHMKLEVVLYKSCDLMLCSFDTESEWYKTSESVMKMSPILAIVFLLAAAVCSGVKYEPNWKSLDARPLPAWYDEAKIGIFIHWGVFSVPSFGVSGASESAFFWRYMKQNVSVTEDFLKKNYRPDWTYGDFASQFTAEFYNPDQWAKIFKAAGAKYVVVVTKHCEGFTNWPSKHSFNWNSMDVGPKRDLTGDLANAIRKQEGMHFGVYHSLFEFYNPYFLQDQANGFKTQDFVKYKTMPELYELVNNYKPDVIWSDGDWSASDTYWNSTNFLAWLYNESPVKDTVVTNDRWGKGCMCHHGGYYTCHDRYNPGKLQPRKWENCMTLDKGSWGYRRTVSLDDFLSMDELVSLVVETVSCGGNILMNVGPTHDGRIIPVYEERLRQLGSWLDVNGEAIYATKPWTAQNDTATKGVWYTMKKTDGETVVYALALTWPSGVLTLGSVKPTQGLSIMLLGYSGSPFKWSPSASGGIDITIPVIPFNKMPCDWGWVFKLKGLA